HVCAHTLTHTLKTHAHKTHTHSNTQQNMYTHSQGIITYADMYHTHTHTRTHTHTHVPAQGFAFCCQTNLNLRRPPSEIVMTTEWRRCHLPKVLPAQRVWSLRGVVSK